MQKHITISFQQRLGVLVCNRFVPFVACRRGIDVVLIVDGFGQKLSGALMTKNERDKFKKAVGELRAAGARIILYDCSKFLQRFFGSGMHIKIQLSDAGGALFSSGNISRTSYDHWNEFSMYCEGEILSKLLDEFAVMGVNVPEHHYAQLQQLPVKESEKVDT